MKAKRGTALPIIAGVFALLFIIGALSSIHPSRAQAFIPTVTVFMPVVLRQYQAPIPTSTNTLVPPLDTPTITPPEDVQITYIEYDPPGGEVDGEYVRIQNLGGAGALMTNWTLRDIANHVYTFPTFVLAGSAQVRVWTKAGSDTSTDLYWGSDAAIWINTGDTAYLRDQNGTLVDTYTYSP